MPCPAPHLMTMFARTPPAESTTRVLPSPARALPPSSRTPVRSPPVWRTSSLTPIPSTPRGVTHD